MNIKRVFYRLSGVLVILYLLFPTIVRAQSKPDNFSANLGKIMTLNPFDPNCGESKSCKAWQSFRSIHPFPYQAFAVAPLSDGSATLIISEPSPVPQLTKSKLEQIVRAAFGTDLVEYTTRRWMVGVDGWLEDVVAKIKLSSPQYGEAPENDPIIQNRVGVLQKILFGTRLGGVLERADVDYKTLARASASDIAANPAELRAWISSQSAGWTPLDPYQSGDAVTLETLLSNGPAGGYIGADRQLNLFVLPAKTLNFARDNTEQMEALRRPFRLFAVSSDEIIGGVWNQDGGLALVSRSRRAPQQAVPPLRFETFAALALENAKELQQSYERTNLFAGKLMSGPQMLHDWAPILLSDSLKDSEFGALLNVTDQLLKSWSEGGRIDYLYFEYPLTPQDGFVFGKEPLSDIVLRETGGTSVLFNWNTAGAAVKVSGKTLSLLSAGHTSSLPVTYGSDLGSGEMQTGDKLPKLREREKAAYKYFVSRQDPNLARVVSYNLIYQTLQFANPRQAVSSGAKNDENAVLVEKAKALLSDIETGRLKPLPGWNVPIFSTKLKEAQAKLLDYYKQTGKTSSQLAQILADPRHVQVNEPDMDIHQFIERANTFNEKQNKLLSRSEAFNLNVKSVETKVDPIDQTILCRV